MKTTFIKPYTKVESKPSECGSRLKPTYEMDIRDDGRMDLRQTGETDIYEEIQAHADEVTIEAVLNRVAVGDMSDFRPDGIYQDITKIPNNLIEAQKEILKVHNLWYKLPLDVKEKYDNDINVFMKDIGSEAWLIDAGFMQEPTLETPIEKVSSGVLDAVPETPETSK